jgi:hypothetical protein
VAARRRLVLQLGARRALVAETGCSTCSTCWGGAQSG